MPSASARLLRVVLILALGTGVGSSGLGGQKQAIELEDRVDWPSLLSDHDLVWEKLPDQWNEGAFAGNGQMGFVMYADLPGNCVVFHLGRMDVTDHRKAPDRKTSLGVPGADLFFDFPRLDVGRMTLQPAGKILGGNLRMDLWNAEIRGTLTTDRGEIQIRALTLRERMVHLVEISSTEKDPQGHPAGWRWDWVPGNPSSPRALVRPQDAEKIGYVANPPPQGRLVQGMAACVQPLTAGGDFATVWKEDTGRDGHQGVLWISTANEVPAADRSADHAATEIQEARKLGVSKLVDLHRAWWQQYYRRSFLSLPDRRLENFFWIQIYKMACCLRPDGPVLDVLGPFYRTTAWPGLWWNLNVQLSYWPVYASNHLELGRSLARLLDEQFPELLAKFANSPSLGDFAWALHNYWWQLRFAGGWEEVIQRWLPKAEAVVAAYEKKLSPGPDGKLRLGPMGSPEYRGFTPFLHTSYNLALLRWLLQAVEEAKRQGPGGHGSLGDAPLARQLAPFAVDENGLRIAENQALEISHRHFSHLLALYPLFQLSPDDPADRALAITSLRHWHAVEGGKALTGYSLTGGAALYAALGMGEEAEKMLQEFLAGKSPGSQLHANTFYTESGGRNPVIETPLSGASATMDLLLQSWGGKIRVFPALPKSWKQCVFRDLRAQGGFRVSAGRTEGKTAWVRVVSEAGEPSTLVVPDWRGDLELRRSGQSREGPVTETIPGEYLLKLAAAEEIILYPKGTNPKFEVSAISHSGPDKNFFGQKEKSQPRPDPSYPEPKVNWQGTPQAKP
jgi:hypothetical protein